MNKSIIFIIAIAIILAGIVFLASPKNNSGNEKPISNLPVGMMADMNSYDFGQIQMKSGAVTHAFRMKNITNEPVKLGKMYTSCMCTTATIYQGISSTIPNMMWKMGPVGMPGHGLIPSINRTVNPGEEFTVEAIFDPAAHGPAGVGPIERVIYLESDTSAPVELTIKAMVTP